jgi:hypothetical protein
LVFKNDEKTALSQSNRMQRICFHPFALIQIAIKKGFPAMKGASQPIELSPIGVIRTPYEEQAPYQPIEDDHGDFRIGLLRPYQNGLVQLTAFDTFI